MLELTVCDDYFVLVWFDLKLLSSFFAYFKKLSFIVSKVSYFVCFAFVKQLKKNNIPTQNEIKMTKEARARQWRDQQHDEQIILHLKHRTFEPRWWPQRNRNECAYYTVQLISLWYNFRSFFSAFSLSLSLPTQRTLRGFTSKVEMH